MHSRYNTLNEESTYQSMYSNEDIIEKLGEVDIYEYSTKSYIKIKPSNIIKVASDALYKMQRDYNYLYQFITKCKLMYIPTFPSDITNTMAVDNSNNLWMNLTFIYNDCKMDSEIVFGILFHELFHIFFEHLLRFDKKFPKSIFASAGPGVFKRANAKANICMDYEVNASMVEDNIVKPNFFKIIDGLYKKEYTGMTWEEILDKYGDKEYDEWLKNNGESLDNVEKQVLDAIEEAAKVLLDPESDDADKRFARKRLQDRLDKIFGKQDTGERSLQDTFEELSKTKLADHGFIASELEDVVDDLMRNPENMNSEELEKTLNDIDKLMNDIEENSDAIGSDFNKTSDEVHSDAENARNTLKDAMRKLQKGGLSQDEKNELIDKAKDALEDIISDEAEKDRLKEKRAERDAEREKKRKERLKKTHPMRKLLIVFKNLAELYEIKLISEKTRDELNNCVNDIDALTELRFSEMKKSDMKNLVDHLNEVYDSIFPDLVKLIENETILQKTEDDLRKILDDVFENLFNALKRIFDKTIDDDAKGSLIKTAAMKLRTIGKLLKTQKKWRASDDFKRGYKDEMKRLMGIFKEGGDEALFKELYDSGVINPMLLDEKGRDLLAKLFGGDRTSKIGDDETTGSDYHFSEDSDIPDYEGIIYYSLENDDESGLGNALSLSDIPDGLEDSDYEKFAKKFEKDFPEYFLEEEMESIFTIYRKDGENIDIDKLKKELEDHPEYKLGEWVNKE